MIEITRDATGLPQVSDDLRGRVEEIVTHADCLSLVDRIETMARVRGWIAEVQP